jgi:hypothetical protein
VKNGVKIFSAISLGSCLKYVRGWCKETENTQENQVGSKEEAENRQVYMGFS